MKAFGSACQMCANRSHAKQSQRLAAQPSRFRSLPLPGLLGLDSLEHPLLMKQQIAKYEFGHQGAEHIAGVCQNVITALGYVDQWFHARIHCLSPFETADLREYIANQFWLTDDKVGIRRLIYNFKTWEMPVGNEARVLIFVV